MEGVRIHATSPRVALERAIPSPWVKRHMDFIPSLFDVRMLHGLGDSYPRTVRQEEKGKSLYTTPGHEEYIASLRKLKERRVHSTLRENQDRAARSGSNVVRKELRSVWRHSEGICVPLPKRWYKVHYVTVQTRGGDFGGKKERKKPSR